MQSDFCGTSRLAHARRPIARRDGVVIQLSCCAEFCDQSRSNEKFATPYRLGARAVLAGAGIRRRDAGAEGAAMRAVDRLTLANVGPRESVPDPERHFLFHHVDVDVVRSHDAAHSRLP